MRVFAYDDRQILPSYIRQQILYYANNLNLNITLIGRSKSIKNGFPAFSDGICMPPGIGCYQSTLGIAACENLLALFDQRFVNYSTNHYLFERACFDRWFALNLATNELHDDEHVCLLDSDFLSALSPEILYSLCVNQSMDSHLDFISDWEFVDGFETPLVRPSVTIIRKSALQNLCDFIFFEYFGSENSHTLLAEYYVHISRGKLGGVCDMRAIGCWLKSRKYQVFNVSQLHGYEMRSMNNVNFLIDLYAATNPCHIKIGQGQISLNYGNHSINLLGIHFQGRSKHLLAGLDFSSSDCQPATLHLCTDQADVNSKRSSPSLLGRLLRKARVYKEKISRKISNSNR